MFKLPKIKFVADLRTAIRMWSIRLGGVASIIITYVIADPSMLFSIVGFMPEGKRLVVAVLIGLGVFALVTFTRLAKQEKLDECPKNNDE